MKSRKRILAVLLAVIMIFSIAGASMAADMPAAAETPAATDTFQETLISAETPSASPSASPDPSVTPAPSSAQAAQSEALDTAVMALDEKTGIDALPLTTEGDEILISSPDDLPVSYTRLAAPDAQHDPRGIQQQPQNLFFL